MKKRSEHDEQVSIFDWAAVKQVEIPELRLLFAIPNGGLRNKVTASKLKAEGVKSGVPDMFLPVARGRFHGLFIELKKVGGRKATDNQHEWMTRLTDQGYDCYVCYGAEPAILTITSYLN